MKTQTTPATLARIILRAKTAADLMTPNPLSIEANATVKEAAAFLTDRGISAAPVIDRAGRAVGVLSQSDIVVHEREKMDYAPASPDSNSRGDLKCLEEKALGAGFGIVDTDRTRVREIMTPLVFSVLPETPARKVIEDMLAHNVHRMFVVGADGVLVGVISTFDVLRRLCETAQR